MLVKMQYMREICVKSYIIFHKWWCATIGAIKTFQEQREACEHRCSTCD